MFPENPSEKINLIAEAVLKLSDFYIKNPDAETPWTETYCQVAYRHYYLPLNYLRVQKIIERGNKIGFFIGLKNFIDWGCGPGTASLALASDPEIKKHIQKQVLYDISPLAVEAFADLHAALAKPQMVKNLRLEAEAGANSCLVFSYSLTEIPSLPQGWDKYEALMIAEPSTSEDGRRLMALRSEIIKAGYHIWAPCTHHLNCPLLVHSKNDWCHDRLAVEAPDWYQQLEHALPMKNKTITFSYLLARKTPPSLKLKSLARLTGDSMEEKGKTRQLVCRNSEREFLTWMHKSVEVETLPRGELVTIPDDSEKKSNEIRLKSTVPVF